MTVPIRDGRSRRRRSIAASAAIAVALCTSAALAQQQEDPAEFALGIGYAHLRIGGSGSTLHSEDALRFDPVLSFAPLQQVPQLRLGGAFGFALVFDDSQRAIVSNDNGLTVVGSNDVPLVTLEPEARISWRQYLDRGHTFFVEPGVGAGAVFGYLSIGPGNNASGPSINEWDQTWSARAFVNVGWRVEGGVAGLQMSYMRGGDLDF